MFRSLRHPKPFPRLSLADIVNAFIPEVLTQLILEYARVFQQEIHVIERWHQARLIHPNFDYNLEGRYYPFIRPTNYTGNDVYLYILDVTDIGCNPVYSRVLQYNLTGITASSLGDDRVIRYKDIGRFQQIAKGQAFTMLRDEVYLIGGTRYFGVHPYTTRRVFKLTQSMTPVSIPRLCRYRTFGAAVTVNNWIYCIGGTAESRKTGRSMEVYDGVKWRLLKSKMHFCHQYHTAVAYDHYIIVTGGYVLQDKELVESRQTEVYNITTDQWELKLSLIPEWGYTHKLFLFNDQIMLTDWSKKWWVYNLSEDTWSEYEPSIEMRYPWPIVA